MKVFLKNGQTSIILRVRIPDTTSVIGGGKTGLTFSSSGLIIATIADNEAAATTYTQAGSTIENITTLGIFAAPTATKCRFKEVDSANLPGLYEIQIADARWAVNGARSLIVSLPAVSGLGTGSVWAEVQLTAVDPQDAMRFGLTALPNAVAAASGGLPTLDSALSVASNLKYILGTLLTESVPGYLVAAFKKLLDVAVPIFTAASVNQTGDSYTRLGAPAGASLAADIAEIEAETDDIAAIKAKTDLLGVSVSTNIVSPIATDGTITVYLSRDFNSTDGLSIDIPVNVTLGASDTITWNAGPYGAYWLTVACTRLDANHARLQLTATNAASLNEGRSRYEVVVTPNGTTRKIEAASGVLVVEAVIVP